MPPSVKQPKRARAQLPWPALGALSLLLPVQAASPGRAYDGFDYLPGLQLAELGEDRDWKGPWEEEGPGSPTIVGPNGLFFKNLVVTGGSCAITGRDPVRLIRPLGRTYGEEDGVVYLSALVCPLEKTEGRRLELGVGDYRIGKTGARAVYAISGGGAFTGTHIEPRLIRTDFLVARLTFRRNGSRCELWVNPTPGQPLPEVPDAALETATRHRVSRAELHADQRCAFDEWRIGHCWEDVSPTGEAEFTE